MTGERRPRYSAPQLLGMNGACGFETSRGHEKLTDKLTSKRTGRWMGESGGHSPV